MTEQEPAGRIKHQPDCPCKVCKSVRTADARRQAEAEESATVRAMARAVVQLMARGALSGPDALRGLIGEADAIRVLRLAGVNAEPVAAGWQATAPVQPAHQSRTAALWAASPDHDPRMLQVLTRPGVTDAEIAAVRAELTEEYRARATQRSARRDSSVMWRTPSGELVRDGGTGPPVQASSVVHRDVPPLGSEA